MSPRCEALLALSRRPGTAGERVAALLALAKHGHTAHAVSRSIEIEVETSGPHPEWEALERERLALNRGLEAR